MNPTLEKFAAGFFGALLLAAICMAIVGIELFLFIRFGMFWGLSTFVLAIALFAGAMNAVSPEKKKEEPADAE
jgi:hypothetical protein